MSIPTSSEGHSDLLKELVAILGPQKVRADSDTLCAYSTDASIYGILPRAVVFVEEEHDVPRILEYCRDRGIPLTPRAAGTSLSGSAIGPGIILDFSKYNRIIEINKDEGYARVQAGVPLRELNAELKKHSLFFPPDPGSQDVCRIGGILGHNASGPRSVKYGRTKNYVMELVVYLWNGHRILAKNFLLDDPELQTLLESEDCLNKLYEIVAARANLITSRRVAAVKNVSGYDIFDLADGLQKGRFDLTRIFLGSEGTLGIITEAKLKVLPMPQDKLTLQLFFDDMGEIGEAVTRILELKPAAVELVDGKSLDLLGREKYGCPLVSEAMLLVEFDEGDLEGKVAEVRRACGSFHLSSEIAVARSEMEQETLWKAREGLLPNLYKYDEKRRPWTCAEDTAVPVERVPDFLRELQSIAQELQLVAGMYVHIGDGNVHFRPLFDLTNPEDIESFKAVHERVHGLAISYGGSITAEHGDGRHRQRILPRLYGDDIYDIFLEIKRSFDPVSILNPGVKLGTRDVIEGLDYIKLMNKCVTCGKCNPTCPVYDVEMEEEHGARGWFRIIKSLSFNYLASKRLLDECLNCKSCRIVCPAGVDVSEEILDERSRYPENGLNGLFFGMAQTRPRIFKTFTRLLGATQFIWDTRLFRAFAELISRQNMLTLHKETILPPLSRTTLEDRWPELKESGGKVAYFPGCAQNTMDNGVGDAVIRVLLRNGIKIAIPRWKCSGTPMITYGWIDQVKKLAMYNVESLLQYETIITSCASCNLMLKSEYQKLFRDDPYWAERANVLGQKVMDISEFLINKIDLKPPLRAARKRKRVTYHDPCHLRASGITREPREILRRIPTIEFVEMKDADRCCGAAGTYVMKNRDRAIKIFERKRRAVLKAYVEVVASSCPSCQMQFHDGMHGTKEVKHVIQLLDEAYAQ